MNKIQTGALGLALLGACGGAPSVDDSLDALSGKADSAAHSKVAVKVKQTNLVGDTAGVAANMDANLINPWGIAFNPQGGPWISDNHSGVTTVYDSTGVLKLTVTIPAVAGATDPAAPTGQVFNDSDTDFNGEKFIFVTEDGTVSGWKPQAGATLHVDNSAKHANYKGVTLAKTGCGAAQLYAASFGTAAVDVFDSNYAPVTTSGGFVDATLPAGYAPFNVKAINGVILVAYALQDSEQGDDVRGAGHGYINAFDTDGNFIQRVVSQGALNSPWGLAIAPPCFGKAAGALLVGNFGDGHINAYKLPSFGGYSYGAPKAAKLIGSVSDTYGAPVVIENLWALEFAPNANGFNSNQLYFTAGPSDETHGVFGRLELP